MKQNDLASYTSDTPARLFFRYVSRNILGMLSLSAYILADTFFIAQAQGTAGITALNLVLPLYSLIFAIGAMLGTGSATRFCILQAGKQQDAGRYFTNALLWALILSLPFIISGLFLPQQLLMILGADASIVAVGTPYTRVFMSFAPFFMLNHIMNAFVRNDNDPSLAMTATLVSSLFNIVMDYLLMFPLGMGMTGAALATAFSPIVGVIICLFHLRKATNALQFRPVPPSVPLLLSSCQLGISAFIGEMASGVTTMIFNFLILGLTGNVGVAAFGVVANIAIVATAIFNGIAQGAQPICSDYYGRQQHRELRTILRYAILTALAGAVLLVILAQFLAPPVAAIFNSEHDPEMDRLAIEGIRLYFLGYLFAGINIVGVGCLGATAKAGGAFAVSMMRGVASISVCAVVLAKLLGMTGVWLAFPAAELLTLPLLALFMRTK